MKRLFWTAVGVLVLLFAFYGVATAQQTLCGNGSEPDYGFTHDTEQDYWLRGYESYMSEDALIEADETLHALYTDNIIETVVQFLPADKVGNRVNCAVHYLRYMKMGRSYGPRQDNGYSLLFVVESSGDLDVHYGVGLGLPAMTAPHLTEINRIAEQTYDETGSYDKAVLAAVNALDEYARELYEPITDADYERLYAEKPVAPVQPQVTVAEEPAQSFPWGILCFLGIVIVIAVILVVVVLGSSGSTTTTGGYGGYSGPSNTTYTPPSRPSSRPSSSPFSSPSRPSRSSPSISRPSSRPSSPSRPSRSGRGGGRSGRGN